MREQLRKEIVKRTGKYVQSAAAAAAYEEESEKITKQYDDLVKGGLSELEAYQKMLADIEKMKEVLASIPASEAADTQEQAERARETQREKQAFRSLVGGMQGVLPLLTVIWYFLYSTVTHNWATSWMMFLGSTAGAVLLNILVKHNEGVPWHKCSEWHAILWLVVTLLYFYCGFFLHAWALPVLLFPGAAIVEIIHAALRKK